MQIKSDSLSALAHRRFSTRFSLARKRIRQSGFFTPRFLTALLFCAVACLIAARTLPAFFQGDAPAKFSQRTLSFAERVAYQHAIEDVYWRHRIWPGERPDPKPSIDAIMSQAQLEKKVTDYLRKSQALEDYWQRPITAEQLQAEMDRMAKHTKQPEVLQELFAALGNDPFVIAECLARPVLAERLLTDLYARDHLKEPLQSWLAKAEAQAAMTVAVNSANYTLPVIASSSGGCIDDTWTPTGLTNVPASRELHTAVWTGSEMIVWGGYFFDFAPRYLNTGGKYNPSTDSWTATSTTNAPPARSQHTAVWTGSEMVVWGGYFYDGSQHFLNTGGRYDPSNDSWTATSTANAPAARSQHTAVWSGTEMIIWGGENVSDLNSGGRYNLSTDTWTATSTTNAPAGRELHTAVWTGSQMIVWGGWNASGQRLNTGGRYNSSTNSWTATSTSSAPDARESHTAVWTGSEMIVWGGGGGSGFWNTGGRYNSSTDSWTATSITNAPAVRYYHTAVWTGSEMIVWGGVGFSVALNTGGRYNPSTDSWMTTSTAGAPDGRELHTAVWTGSQMIVWGGYNGDSGYLNTGGRYCAQSGPPPTPTPTPTPCAGRCTPTPRPRPSPAPRPSLLDRSSLLPNK
jgi:N-acetylneuraminic acid mutarotase